MRTLGDAWSWYLENRRLVRLMGRLGRRHWEAMPWEDMERDQHFRHLEGKDVAKKAT